MSNALQNLNKTIKRINTTIDTIQNVGGGIKVNSSEIAFNTLIGENVKTLSVRLGRKPEAEWSLTNFNSSTSPIKPSNAIEGVNTTYSGNLATRTIGYYDGSGGFVYEEYSFERDVERITVSLSIESPNPELIEINPTELEFTEDNWNEEKEVQIILVDRARYATEYYDRVKIVSTTTSGISMTYSDNVDYVDINIYSSNQRESYAKGREVDSLESYKHPVNYSEEKLIVIEKFQIIGSIVGGHYTAYPTVEFNGKYYNRKDPNVLQIIAQLAGTTPDLIIMPGEIPEYGTPSSPPLDSTHYAIVGIDGRVFQSNGDPEITKHTSKFPDKIKISVSDKINYEFDLSSFSTINSPPPVNSQSNFGPLDRGIIEVEVNEEYTADQCTNIMPNGDSAFYIYSFVEGASDDFLDIQTWCGVGFLLYRPFVLKPIIKHTKNVWDTSRGTITHTFVQRADADFIQYLDSHNKYEKRSGYTVFDKDYFAPEIYFKHRYKAENGEYSRIFFKGSIYQQSNLSDLAGQIDPNVDIKPYYISMEDIYPTVSNKWFTHSETPYVRVDYQSNTGYIFLRDQLSSQSVMRKFSSPTKDPFVFDDSLKEEPLVRCNTDIINAHKLSIIGFA